MLHGGAGDLNNVNDNQTAVRYLESLRTVLEHGRDILTLGGSALQTVEACTTLLEDDPLFNAGCGSVLNEAGEVEMDAAIMNGYDLSAGAVAGISDITNPIQLARRILSQSEHVMLVGSGALRFADRYDIPRAPKNYFLTADRLSQLKQAQTADKMMLDHDEAGDKNEDDKHGTIGAVAFDLQGNLAAATSTGGIVNKRLGRVGDSPIIGAGVYADNETCAVSATGYGEDFMRTVFAKTISDYIAMQEMNAGTATQIGIEYLQRRVSGRGGVIVIDRQGNCASGFTTKKMIHGWIEHGGSTVVRF